jgi:hypothetical protein
MSLWLWSVQCLLLAANALHVELEEARPPSGSREQRPSEWVRLAPDGAYAKAEGIRWTESEVLVAMTGLSYCTSCTRSIPDAALPSTTSPR